MTKTCECGCMFNEEGVCTNCGLMDDEYSYLRQYNEYPYDPDRKDYQHGDVRTHAVSDISTMTIVNPQECEDPNLRRALKWDKNYNWSVVKSEIMNMNMKHVCSWLGLSRDFTERCHYFFRKIKDKTIFTGKLLENAAAALVYTIIRLDALPYTLYDFKLAGFNSHLIYRHYISFIKQWDLVNSIKGQDTKMFVTKFINSIFPDDPETFRLKFELIRTTHGLFLYYYGAYNLIEYEKLINNIEDLSVVVNNSGLPILAAIVYAVCKKHPQIKITQSTVADAAGVTEVTIRNYLSKIKLFVASAGES